MRGLGGPFVGVGSAVLIAAAGFYYFAPTSWIFAPHGAAPAVAAKPAPAGAKRQQNFDF